MKAKDRPMTYPKSIGVMQIANKVVVNNIDFINKQKDSVLSSFGQRFLQGSCESS